MKDVIPFPKHSDEYGLDLDEADTPRRPFKNTAVTTDARAVPTLAPASLGYAVRAPPARQSGESAGLSSSLPHVRSLQDWEVEDLVLLATVDGTIHARDRNTGAERWALEVDRPMVDVMEHRHNDAPTGDGAPEDRMTWIVEPVRDGELYIYSSGPKPGLQRLGLTVRKLVEDLSPYASDDPPVVYTAEKKNTLYTIDAGTGRVLKVFSAGGSSVNEESSCRRVTGLEALDDAACGSSGTLTLGRAEYVVGIQSRDTGEPLCTIRYAEWGPNNRDADLEGQHVATMDQKYVYTRHDGSVFGYDLEQAPEDQQAYVQKFPTPVARVFDVVRPADADAGDASLVLLPQPIGPSDVETDPSEFSDRIARIFVNRTEDGGWYALSEVAFPFVTGGASLAPCYSDDGRRKAHLDAPVDSAQQEQSLVGVHSIAGRRRRVPSFPALAAPSSEMQNESPAEVVADELPFASSTSIANSRLLGYAAQNVVDIGLLFPLLICAIFLYVNRRKLVKLLVKTLDVEKIPGVKDVLKSPPPTPAVPEQSFASAMQYGIQRDGHVEDDDDGSKTPTEPKATDVGLVVDDRARNDESTVEDGGAGGSAQPPKKKKTHRGQRGGAGRRKARKDHSQGQAVDDIVQQVKEIGRESPLEPDVVQLTNNSPNGIADVSGAFQINNLVVTDSVLGYGSHGTIVYKGSFEGREVAVKRMLLEFYDVASHEVGLLQESDDHPNVIRYFCRQQSAGFLYIALELCPASLQDVIERPTAHELLVQAALRDLPSVLYQIAAGVRYLHSLKIVHRDLKPQNILVAPPRATRTDAGASLPPRMLISDFGLCKKLEGDQSSFRATTAHAAGTSGWRAPELLVDDDDHHATRPLSATSESGTSHGNSEPAIIDTLSNRRATRAIDIFSLGCVFFYILSRGGHPYGDRYMREANIVKGHYRLDQLRGLDNYGNEAAALIEMMLDQDSRKR